MKVRVLLIDEHEDARSVLAERLHRDGEIEVVGVARDAAEARALANGTSDLVLMGVPARGVDPAQACRALRELTGAPVVIFTTFITPELWAAAREAGAADYILKRSDSARLRREILRMAQRYGGASQA